MKAHIISFLTVLAGSWNLPAQEYPKAIPLEKEQKTGGAVVAYQDSAVSLTVAPATVVSNSVEGGLSTQLQQQMNLTVMQALTPWLSVAYGAGAGFHTQELQLLRREDQMSAYVTMLNRPALTWKPRPGVEIEAAYQMQQNLNNALATDQTNTATLQEKTRIGPNTTVGMALSDQQSTAFDRKETQIQAVRLTSEYAMSTAPLTLQLNPGYENTQSADRASAIRAFVENAVIWKIDRNVTLIAGSGFAGNRDSLLSQNGYLTVQHNIAAGTSLELRAAMLSSAGTAPGESFAISADSSLALAQALSAGLSLRYKMDQNSADTRSETFLSLSINGKF